jgi:bifunctional non-homologous end joining protein LigD
VFKSWAVPKGLSLDPSDKRMAVEVEDHPLDYGDFEGTIPKGQHGGGTVQLWDRGYWMPEGDPHKALKKGNLRFAIAGDRLQGTWHLVRRRLGGSKRPNWFLFKSKDHHVKPGEDPGADTGSRSVASGRTLEEIAAGKGKAPSPFMSAKKFKAGAVWQSNRAEAGDDEVPAAPAPKPAHAKPTRVTHMPQFVEPQLCQLVDRAPGEALWIHEVKLDGYRMQLRIEDGDGALRTRKGLDWTRKFSAIATAGSKLPDCLIDGEICAMDRDGAPDFAALQVALSEENTDELIFFAFDLLFEKQEDLRDLPLSGRKERLRVLLSKRKSNVIRYVDHFSAAGDAILKSACKMKLEGIVSKRLDAPYRSGRTGTWTKAKCRGGHELVIGGWTTEGERFRSLFAAVNRDDKLVYVGRVGTGFGAATVKALMPKLLAVETDTNPFAKGAGPPRRGGIQNHWARPELVAEIEFAGWTGDGQIRQASFNGLRADKPAAEIEVETPIPAGDVTPAKPSRGVRTGSNVVLGVSISNPDKPMWPDEKPPITKIDLARYYETVGDWMIDYLRGRPSSIVRTPDGIKGEQFFQRHAMPGQSHLVTLATVSDDKKPYLQLDTVEALIAIAQVGTTEIHPWNCQPGEYDLPGRFVFDLDPAPDVLFEAVIAGAKELSERLKTLGCSTFCKTTGGKGLHVVVPLTPDPGSPDWNAGKLFCMEVCRRMAADTPDKYLINMSKKERTGRIFLDYLRNDTKSTAVAPLSTRARPGATVSMPVDWTAVRKGLDPTRFTVRTAPRHLKKSKPWCDYAKAAVPLRSIIERLIGSKP